MEQNKNLSKHRAYSFTLNNYTSDQVTALKEIKYKYIVLGDEIGESGTPHIQGYIVFTSPISFSSIKKKIPKAHIEVSKGNAEQNRDYCSKQTLLYEDGDIPLKAGKRTDIDHVREVLQETPSMREVTLVAQSYQAVKIAEQYLKYHEKKRDWKPTVKWYYGGTGTGKSKAAYEELEDPYTCADTNKWWEGYDAHENVIIDDFRKDFIKFHDLLKLLDRYPYRIECKGSSRQLLARTIIITTPYHPKDTYENQEDINQLLRRIDDIQQFN